MNLSQIKNRVYRLVNEDESNPVFFPSAEVEASIIEALEVISEEVSEIRKETYFSLIPGTALYNVKAIAPDAISPFRLTSQNNDTHIRYGSLREINSIRHRWLNPSDTVPYIWYRVSWDMFGIYPAPTVGNTILRVNYIAEPDTAFQTGVTLDFSEEFHGGVVLYTVYDLLMKQWDTEQALDYFNQFMLLWKDKAARHLAHRYQAEHRLPVERPTI